MISTSRMSGHVGDRRAPRASSAAAISLSTLFLAPVTRPRPQAGAAGDPEHLLHARHIVRPARRGSRPGRIGSAHGQPHAHLHPHRRRRHHLAGRHEPHHQERPAAGGLRRCRRGQLRHRRRPWPLGELAAGRARPAAAHPERALRRGRRPVHPGGRRARRTRRCGWSRRTSSASRPSATRYNDRLPPLRSFVLPGGTAAAALLHVARTVVRRAERATWAAIAEHGEPMNAAPGDLPEPALGPAVHPGPRTPTWPGATSSGCPAATAADPAQPGAPRGRTAARARW